MLIADSTYCLTMFERYIGETERVRSGAIPVGWSSDGKWRRVV